MSQCKCAAILFSFTIGLIFSDNVLDFYENYRRHMDVIVDNKYKMIKKIGSGAFGDIYRGKRASFHLRVVFLFLTIDTF